MSWAISSARPGSVSIVSRSMSSMTDSERTLSWPSVSTHAASSGGRSPPASRSARLPTPSSAERYCSGDERRVVVTR